MWNTRGHGKVKWTITNHTKAQSSSKEGDVVYMVELGGSPLLWAPSEKPNNEFQQALLPIRPTERITPWKASGISRKRIIFPQDNARPQVTLMTRKNCYSLAGKFWFIHHSHQTLHLWISIYYSLCKIPLMENLLVPWKTVKGTWNSSLLKMIKSFGKRELWSCLKGDRR